MTSNEFFIPGHRETESEPPIYLDVTTVDEDYFGTLGLELRSGRLFDVRDTADTAPVAVVTEALARRFWPNETAIGKRVRAVSGESVEVEIVGVVNDYKIRTPGETPRPMVHFAWNQRAQRTGVITYRTASFPEGMLERVIGAARAELPDLLVVQSTTMARMRDVILLPLNLGGKVVTGLGSIALLLAILGLAGSIIYWVSRHRREIGLRMALGAGRSAVLRLIAGRVFAVVGVGLVVGGAVALALGRLLESVLYVPAFDTVSLAVGVLVLLVAGVLASVVPTRRATAVDPMAVLREQ
jgi:putative ABC transport system permease protein